MVSGQWEISRRPGVELWEAPQEEGGLAGMPLRPAALLRPAGTQPLTWGWAALLPLPSKSWAPNKSHTPSMAEGKTEGAWVPKVTPTAPTSSGHTVWDMTKNTGLTWLICHKLSFQVQAAKYCPNCNKMGNLKLSVNLPIENVTCSISGLFYCNY